MASGRTRWWLLTVVVLDPFTHAWCYRSWPGKGRTAVTAHLGVLADHRAAPASAPTRPWDNAYANALLLGAWPITAVQAREFE